MGTGKVPAKAQAALISGNIFDCCNSIHHPSSLRTQNRVD
jgi:hypothetical protein